MNIGSSEEISILELAKLVKKCVNFQGELTFDKEMPDGNPRKLLDSSKILSYGWKPEIELEEGIKNSYDWFLKNLVS